MFLFLLLAIGFFITGSTFGANIIGAFELVIYAYWASSILITLAAIAIVLSMTAIGAKYLKGILTKVGAFIGGSIGMVVAIGLLFFQYAMLWLSYFIVENTSPVATNWENIGETAQNAIVVYLVITVLSITQSKFSFRFFTITKGYKNAISK